MSDASEQLENACLQRTAHPVVAHVGASARVFQQTCIRVRPVIRIQADHPSVVLDPFPVGVELRQKAFILECVFRRCRGVVAIEARNDHQALVRMKSGNDVRAGKLAVFLWLLQPPGRRGEAAVVGQPVWEE